MNNLNRIVLGTAQFQNGYGITKKEIINPHKVLNIAHKLKIKFLDTSPLYGKGENKIGKINFKFNIISKIPRIKNHKIDAQKWVIKNTKKTLKDLKQKKIYAMLLHHPDDLKGEQGDNLLKGLKNLKKKKLVKKIGISIYSFEDIDWILKKFKFDIIQLPFNLLDQRLIKNKWLKKLKSHNIEIHCRSVFLQGLLLKKYQLPKKLNKINKKISEFHNWAKINKIKPINAALNFVLQHKKIDKVILGVDNCDQLLEIINNLDTNTLQIPKKFSINEEKLINPSLWPTKK